MRRHIFVVLILCILFSLLASTAAAQDMLPKGKWWKHPEVLEKIGLSEEQIQRIEKISDEGMRKIIRLEADFRIARMDLESLLDQIDQQKLNLETLENQIDLVNRIRGELEKERIMMLARIRNVLPKEAIEKLKTVRGQFRKGRMGRGGWLDDLPGKGGNDGGTGFGQ